MSGSSDEDDQRTVESASRMWAESQPGPSRCQPSRQGYCGYCRVLYSNLDQHLSSLRHLDSVRASSRGSSTTSSASSSRTKLTLLERFLLDVQQHHPHRYKDPRPSHADLPSVSAPPSPREELDELCYSDNDSRSLGTRERLPSSDDASCQTANQQRDDPTRSQCGITKGAVQEMDAPIREQEEGGTVATRRTSSSHAQTQAPPMEATPPVHRKAHRKTNRRKPSDSSSSPPHMCPDLSSRPPTELRPGPCPDRVPRAPAELRPGPCPDRVPRAPAELRPGSCPDRVPRAPAELRPGPCPDRVPQAPAELRPWLSWQKERREAHKEEAFSSDHADPVDQTIEEVIQVCCYGFSSTSCQQEETESFHFSLPLSMETQSDDWDSPVQTVLQRGRTLSDTPPSQTPVQVSKTDERDLSRLMDVQVDLEDRVYSRRLDSALHSERQAGGGARPPEGFLTLPIEEVLPAPAHIPESFRGKTWAQIEREDEEKVEELVQQFRRQRFVCYFDSESLARYGRRSQNKKEPDENKEAEPERDVLPLLACDEDDSAYVTRRRRKRRAFRVASRCQVVKVSHSTQTVRLVVPAVRQSDTEAPPISVPAANQDAAERTPEAQTWHCLPPSYSNIITPLQTRTSLVYLLCSPSGPAPTYTPAPGSAPKRCRKKRRPLDLQGLKVKYKRLPVRFYDPSSNRILKNPPKGFLWRRGSSLPPPCVRQLFRSLSPDLNTDRPPGEGAAGSSRVKGQRSSDTAFSHASSFLLSTLSRDSQPDKKDTGRRRGRTSQAPPPSPHSRAERGRGGRRDKTRTPPSKRRTRAQAVPPQPRREGLRRAGPGRKVPGSTGPPQPPSPRRGRARRGRGCERTRR